jgi:flagellar L-ring protein precursor FlgH
MSFFRDERRTWENDYPDDVGRPGPPPIKSFAAIATGILLLILAVSLEAQQAPAIPSAPVGATGYPAGTYPSAAPASLPQGRMAALKARIAPPAQNLAANSLNDYLGRVHRDGTGESFTPGSIWSDSGRLAQLSTDVRAMRKHDLISVVVEESLAASTDGSVKNSRASNANSSISALLGTLHAGNALQNLLNQSSASGLTAAGQSATNSSLSTIFGGEVVEVLPNGMLVIEAARQVEFSQQTQTILLRGLVRPEDISQQNQVLSTAISSMELEVRGKGIINDYTHRQNALVRFIQKVLVF